MGVKYRLTLNSTTGGLYGDDCEYLRKYGMCYYGLEHFKSLAIQLCVQQFVQATKS